MKLEPFLKRIGCRNMLFSLILAVASVNIIAANTGICHFYTADQLSSNLITSICQDKQGFIWVSTEYGLNRFDGVNFTSYFIDDNTTQPLLNNNCRKVICDRDGRVWVISYNGIQYYDRLSNSFPILKLDTEDQSYPTDILELNDGRLLVLTIKKGLFLVDKDKMEAKAWEEANKLYLDESASCMYVDSRKRIWICSDKTGLTQLDVKSKRSEHFDYSQLGSNGVNAVCEDGKGRIVVLSRAKVLRYDEVTKTLHEIGTSQGLYRRTLFKTNEGKVLMATYGNGLFEVDIDGNQLIPAFQQTVEGVTLATQSIQAYLEDAQQNKWIGCLRTGVAFLTSHRQPFTYYNMHNLPNDNGGVLSLLTYCSGRFILGQENNGLTDISPDGGVLNHRFPGEYVISYQKSPSDDIWIGTYGRGASISKRGQSALAKIDSLNGKRIKDFAIDKNGILYMAVFDYGMLSFKAATGEPVPFGKGNVKLHNRYPNKLFIDSHGWLWIGHYNGIDVYDTQTEQLVDVPVDSILRPTHTFAITESKDGLIWVGTNKGLFSYNRQKKQWQHLDKDDGLCNEIVCGIVEDDNGDLWISTYHGLSHLLRQKGQFINYYKGSGLEVSSYTRGIYGKAPDGMIYFGNDRGITHFYPSDVSNTGFDKGLQLTGLFVAGREIGTDGEHIRLDYEDNTFTLRFSTMDYRETGNLQYEYRFTDEREGVWHQLPPGVNEMILSHLRFGRHQLMVRVQENGSYSPVKEIDIRITPPWYRSWWAYILYAFLMTFIVYSIFQNVKHKQLADMNEEKIKFFVDLSHELRSPLTLIKSPLDTLLNKEYDQQTNRALRNMSRNTDRLLAVVNQILSIRKIEKGQMKLHYTETSLSDFTSVICSHFDYLAEKRNVKLTFQSEDAALKGWIDREWFDKVISNLLSNAMKYVEAGGEIAVALRQTDSNAVITVTDNGPGIDEEQLKRVFERFYQSSARPKSGQIGYGIGLNLAYKITRLHGGNITAENRTDVEHGTVMSVMIPLGNSHLPKEQLVDESYFADIAKMESQVLTTDKEKQQRTRKKTTYRIAVVDDDEEIRDFLRTELGSSYYVNTYCDGKAALEAVVNDVPDLVISDIVMPEMDGFTLLKRLKNNTKTSHIPVVLLTSRNEQKLRVEGLEQGADAYIDKPFSLEELEARVIGLIENRNRLRGKYMGVQEQTDTLKQIELTGINEEMMKKVMEVINENLDNSDFNVEALADMIGMSRAQLHRRVKEATGITIGEFIRNLRLQQAARMLEKGDNTIQQVAWAVGFSNPTHFSAAFKRYFGIAPVDYMNKHRSATNS